MKLFLCLALFSMSSAEPMSRQNLHQNMPDYHHLDQDHDVYKRDSGSGFTVSGDCTTTPAGGDSSNVNNPGAGTCYLTYEDCNTSTSRGGSTIKKINDVHNAGAGDFYITYCSASTSGEKLLNDLYNAGDGDFYVSYRSASTSGEELIHNVINAGSGKIYIKYSNYGSSASSDTNIRRKLVHDLRIAGSGNAYITYKDCRASSGKLGHDMFLAGAGSLYITNCCASTSSDCEELVNKVSKAGAGFCYVRSRDDPRCQ